MKISTYAAHAAVCLVLWAFWNCAHAQTTHTVTVGNNFFSPANLEIAVGDSVRWINAADNGPNHNVTGGSFASTTAESFNFVHTFTAEGVEEYLCTIHPGSMRGTITVSSGGGGGSADLSLIEVSVNNNVVYEQGGSIQIDAEVENVGSAVSSAYSISFYASPNDNITSGDILLGSVNRAALGTGNSDNFSVNLNLPAGIAPGNYFIGAIININDANNSNNSNLEDETIVVVESSGLAFVINNGLNDAWFNALTPGQGFFITVFPNINSIFLAWFTYDTQRPPAGIVAILGEPGHRWLTAFGGYAGNVAILDIELTSGGVFDSAEPGPVQSAYGTIQIEFNDCNNAILRYDIPSLGIMSEIPITRIALDNVARCLAAQPQ